MHRAVMSLLKSLFSCLYRNQGNIKSDTQQQSHVVLVLILQHSKLISSDKTHAGSFLGISSNSPQMDIAVLAVKEGYLLLTKYIFSYVIFFAEGKCVACKLHACAYLFTVLYAMHIGGMQ